MNQIIELRKEYWKNRKNEFLILLENWLNHEKKNLLIPADKIYNDYLNSGIEAFELSKYKYGKDLQTWLDKTLNSKDCSTNKK